MYSLVTKSPLDREKQSQYDLTITAKDAGQPSLSSEKTISVVVSDVNDNSPEFSLRPYTFYVTEGNDPGASVFSVKASDRDENDNAVISYHIVRDGSEDNKVTSFLNINSDNGHITALKSFDFETLKTFQFQVVATDSGAPSLSSNVTVNVFILDQNDNAPLKASRDRDSGPFSVQQYKLSPNDHFRLEVKEKRDEGKIPILVVQKSLDRETAGSHSLTLTALDGGKPPKSGNMNILVKVLDINDNAPVFFKDDYFVTLGENAPVGTTVIQVNATDLDEGPNGEVIYSFRVLTITGLIDYEEKDGYEIEIEIVDVNDNAPEIEVTSFSSSIPEDSRPGTTVALISASDLDSGLNGKVICTVNGDVPFTLSPSLKDKMFSLVTKSPLDREKQSQYDLTITAKDAGQPSLSSEKTISVVVSDVNDNSPEFSLRPYTFYVTEGNDPGASVFSVKASDRDENDNAVISYHIVRDGSEDNKVISFLNINSDNGHITTQKSFDFEMLKTFQFQVVATDSGAPSLSSNVTVKVFILDQNDNAPVILYPLSSNGSAEGVEEIPRNVNAGHLVTKVRAYDADIGYNGWLLFSLQELTDHSLFGLDRYTGQIRTLRSFTETDEFQVVATDSGAPCLSSNVHYVGIEVLDVNDHSPTFPEKETTLEISESLMPGARIPVQPARDPDSGPFSIQQYKLSSNDHFRLEVKDKGDDGKIPVLIVQKSLDREMSRSHFLVLTALDGGKPLKSGDMNILVNVLDVNDNAPVFSKNVYSVMLDENAPVGTTVIQVNATDLDDGPNGDVVYSFSNSVNRKVIKLFDINPTTGVITVKGLIDYEDKDKYEIEIQASDKGLAPLSTQKSVLIKIVDMNDNAPEIEVTSFSSSIPEDSRPGTTVALISVSDLDSGLNGKVICTVNEDAPFTLSHSLQGKMYSLVTKSPLDREKQAQYIITVAAEDAGQPSLSSEKSIIVAVSDVNDNSPEFSLSPYVFYVTEGNNPGASVFSVKASDRDENDNAAISYHIVRDGSEDNKVTSFLNINSDNGHITALKSFDFETLKTFQFQVVATDSGAPSLSSNVTVNVFILDQNDNAPVILYPLSSNGSAEGVEEIPRNVNAGHLVTKVRAYDADIGYNGWLLFSLQKLTDHSLFSLDRYTGQIRTLRSFTETDEAEHKLVILVKDNGNVSLSATATVIVKLMEPKEAFAVSDVKSAAKIDEDDNVTFYLIITLGSVSVLFIISIIVLIAMQCSKSTDYTSKYLQETNYDGTLCHSIQYRSGDKRYMLVGPRMSIGSTIVPGSHANTLVLPERRRASEEVRKIN
uniref:Protocadherin 2 alpha a 15 n=1 Tax=Amphiprion percula TaxID=161767 RepID=A0A3P8T976_AMPPE